MVLLGLTLTTRAQAVGVTVEVTDAAEALLDSRLARRLITLELADVELPSVSRQVPTRVSAAGAVRNAEVVFVRLLADADVLTVELWASGLLAGERRIRASGAEELQARRVALACAELARRVREARLSERQRVLREHLFPSPTSAVPSYSVAASVGAGASTRAVWLPSVDVALVGPSAGVWIRSQQGLGLELNAAYYHSTSTDGIRFWTELGLRPSWSVQSDAWGLAVGAQSALALLDVGSRASVRGAPESQQTWSARVALDARVTYRLAPKASLTFGPDLGLQLRDVELLPREGAPTHVRGLWLGIGLGAEWFL